MYDEIDDLERALEQVKAELEDARAELKKAKKGGGRAVLEVVQKELADEKDAHNETMDRLIQLERHYKDTYGGVPKLPYQKEAVKASRRQDYCFMRAQELKTSSSAASDRKPKNSTVYEDPESGTDDSEGDVADPPKRALHRGKDILVSRASYGVPKNTPVPECIPEGRCHHIVGKGTNGEYKRYTCENCGFWCKEPTEKRKAARAAGHL
ncbi:hypothetical protein H0H81_009687 [Sphagnurus paluster]|uniref:Uncharacterized protein n=1 Tax=Sphagnurus paluster TaxID=117069 RepID=A0A9P7K2S0_9AGAR|nr:hypothetical protein H0H81_009687 [Sphagnurus paluster]